jgi:hypothetical protein
MSQSMNTPFGKAHDAGALQAALALTDPVARQAALNAMVLPGPRKLVSPQAGLNVTEESPLPGSPADTTARTAAELAELALMVALRDVPLAELGAHPIAIRGAEMLKQFGINRMLYGEGPDGLFRMNAARVGADRIGKLLAAPIPSGWGKPFSFEAYRRLGSYGATEADWVALQAGRVPRPQQLSPEPVPMSTGRDVASLAHQDAPIMIGDCVLRILVQHQAPYSARVAPGRNEQPFVDAGGLVELQCANGIAALPAAEMGWRLKFADFRRQRPEELWRRAVRGELHESFLRLAGWLVELVGPFLPMVYAEGSPLHSDDPSGHAIFAGVWATIGKANFADGSVPSLGIASNLHAEIDLMAWHATGGRAWAGIHTRRSLTAGLRIGELQALRYLQAQKARSPRPLGTTSFVGVDGKLITV